MTLFELLASYYCTIVIHKTLWDYSDDILNFQGRICLRSALAWGFLSLFMGKMIIPAVNEFYNKKSVKRKIKNIVIILVIYTVICSSIKYGSLKF